MEFQPIPVTSPWPRCLGQGLLIRLGLPLRMGGAGISFCPTLRGGIENVILLHLLHLLPLLPEVGDMAGSTSVVVYYPRLRLPIGIVLVEGT